MGEWADYWHKDCETAPVAVVASPDDVAVARLNALEMAGVSEGELREQANSGLYSSTAARLAWMVISGPETARRSEPHVAAEHSDLASS